MPPSAQESGEAESPDWFTDRQRSVRFRCEELVRFARVLRRRIAGGREFGVCIASDATLRRANHQFLGKDYATDVLSFPVERPPWAAAGPLAGSRAPRKDRTKAGQGAGCGPGGPPHQADYSYLGDILISAQRAQHQAERLGHSVEDELKILLLHGVLHLLGYDHERDHGAMSRLERRWRRQLGLPAGLLERGAAA